MKMASINRLELVLMIAATCLGGCRSTSPVQTSSTDHFPPAPTVFPEQSGEVEEIGAPTAAESGCGPGCSSCARPILPSLTGALGFSPPNSQ